MEDEIKLCKTWLRYFSRPAKHYAPRPIQDYARRVSVWAGVQVRTDAFLKAASQLGYEMRSDEDGRYWFKAAVT